jgi:hypothetical protein
MRKIHGYIIEKLVYFDMSECVFDSYLFTKKFYETEKQANEALAQLKENYPAYEFRLVEMFESYTGKCSEGIHWFVWFYENNKPIKRKCRFCDIPENLNIMEYIIITNYSNRSYQCEENDNGFIEKFSNYEDALLYAQQYELEDFEILGLCTKEKNHII